MTVFTSSWASLRRVFPGVVASLFIVFSAFAIAQDAENRTLDQVKASLDAIEAELGSGGSFDDAALVAFNARLEAARRDIAKVTQAVAPRAQTIQSRLEQLGVAPENGASPESPELAQERLAQLAAKAPIDEVLKRASSLTVQADQIADNVSRKRRDLFATRVLARSRSILDPGLWGNVVNEAPRRLAAIKSLFSQWGDIFAERTDSRSLSILGGALFLALIIIWPLRRWMQQLGQLYFAEAAPPTRLRRSAGALWVFFITTAAPVAAVTALYFGLTIPGYVPERLMPFVGAIAGFLVFVGLIIGLSRAILAPNRATWRLPPLSDEIASRLAPYPIWMALVLVLANGLLALLNVTGVGLSTVMVINGVAALATALLFALALMASRAGVEDDADTPASARTTQEYWSVSVGRLAAWLAVITILAAVLVGYIAFGFFLSQQLLWLGVLGGLLYLLLVFVDDLLMGLASGSRIGRFANGAVGLKRSSLEQLAVLASGLLRLFLVVMALLLAIAPWGVQSGDVSGWIGRAFSGIALGGFSVSLSSVFGALVLLIAGVVLTRIVQGWLDKSYLPRTRLDDGLKNSIRTATGYAGVLLAAGLSISFLGFGLDRLALVAGALSVGIGFGLQSIVSNFVSGLILLAERPIKAGDWVVIGSDEGNVQRISVRSTVIEQFDKSILIVPNSDLITKPVRNRTHRNPLGVVRVPIGTGHEADVEQVREIMLEAAGSIPAILANPAPQILITATTDLGVQWLLTCNVPTPRHVAKARSDLYFAVLKEFQAKSIKVTASPAA